MKLDRKMSPESLAEYSFNQNKSAPNQSNLAKKMIVQDFIEPMIGTGVDRSNYKEIVKEFSNRFADSTTFQEVDWYFEVSSMYR
jgi:hypothetical protein